MRKWLMGVAAVVVCGGGFLAGQVSAQEGGGGFQMPEWAQKAPEHAELAKWVGDWTVKQEMWMAPGQPPMESTASATYRSVWDGRFIESEFSGDMMGIPFTGRLLMGYDRVDGEYVSVWRDSLSAYMSISRGPAVDGVITLEMNDPDFMTGKKKKSTLRISWTEDGKGVLVFSEPGPDGKDHTTMRFTYTKKTE